MQINWAKIPRWRRRSMMKRARVMLDFAVKTYDTQHKAGGVFLHEHPATAKSWKEPSIVRLLGTKGVGRFELDMCQYNLLPDNADGQSFIKKPTSILTNSAIL